MSDEERHEEETYSSTKEREEKPWDRRRDMNRYNGPVAPVAASILAIIGWAIFILLYALFWSEGFTLFQNIIVTVVSLFITALLVGLMWVLLGRKREWFTT